MKDVELHMHGFIKLFLPDFLEDALLFYNFRNFACDVY